MDDAQLVEAARSGDRNAVAAIYDRYADGIHDFCASILRNRAEAADALQETFGVAFEGLDQLAEPARLRAWLYALAHRSVLDRVEHYGPDFFADDGELTFGDGADERLSRAELAEFVWQAAGGLDIADRVLLDLHLRQGLEGRDLAGASGVPGPQLDDRLSRLEALVDRALGALVVARTGRRSCPDLYSILDSDDLRLTPELRREITAHVDECERCNPRRRIAPRALGLLATTAPTAAPAYLRGVVLGKAELSGVERQDGGGLLARAGWTFQRDGFPVLAASATDPGRRRQPARPTGPVLASTRGRGVIADVDTDPKGTRTVVVAATGPPPGRHDRLGMLIGALAGIIVLVVVAVVALRPGKKATPVAVIATTTTAAATTTTSPPTTVATASTTTVAPTTVAVNGHLIVGTKSLDLGLTMTTSSFQFGDDGAAPLSFTAIATGAGLSVTPVAGTLAPGASQNLMVTLDRTSSSPGPFTGSIQVTSAGGNVTVPVTAMIDPGPMITNEAEAPRSVSPAGCTNKPTTTRLFTSTISAAVSATQPLKVVVLHSRLSTSSVEATPIPMAMSGTVYTATLGPYQAVVPVTLANSVDWWITAIDNAGATGTSRHGSLTIQGC